MIMDGQLSPIEEARPAADPRCAPDREHEPAGQMFMIRKGVESLLEKGEPLSMLKPSQAWRRISDQLKGTGINTREMPHRSTYNRFRKRHGARYRLR
jgi:hypothetical protein